MPARRESPDSSPAARGTGARRRSPPREAPSPFSRDLELERIAASCDRFIHGAGRRTATQLLQTIPEDTAIDYYGTGGIVEELEAEIARLLGKQAALFLPTGTMAQQATLRVHADRRSRTAVAFHPACHLETHEERGYQRLHGLFGVPVGSRDAPLSLAALEQVHEPLAALVIELPQRDLGGTA
ncbi:MAG: beta-eliminating lyase-related protein, partial [Acidimicrobiales bacterium]